ncbi:hypothetical protein SOVF_160900 [Spinacia oleracea]|uniref:Nudix hydrolase domain-containing protein n=1 Tax=Spinacia oleracea TaxID=3562 RepID=A0A9R0K4N7_SPIOL|nr:uncharacterized protein LOC110797525 [Spinacia oleracea]KNA08635.1 hypothetical protein SOVF_160900 [Spinacia oleracea]
MPQSQPPHPPSNQYNPKNPTVNNQPPLPSFSKSANLPDFLLTALSVFLFITAPKHHLPPRAISLSSPPPSTNRRFIRLTSAMSQNSSPNPNSRAFPTPQSLSDWLKPRLPSDSFSAWGTRPGTKNVHNLWLELADGETFLVDEIPPIRNLEVACVRVLGNNNMVLVESHQELSDGSIRKRNRPLSEKLKSGEDIEAAAKRAIKEELGSAIFRVNDGGKTVQFDEIVRIVMDSYGKKVEERTSVSYPGLPACYVLHTVDAFVEGLPEGEFSTEEETEYEGCGNEVVDEAVSVKKHFWKWVPADSV